MERVQCWRAFRRVCDLLSHNNVDCKIVDLSHNSVLPSNFSQFVNVLKNSVFLEELYLSQNKLNHKSMRILHKSFQFHLSSIRILDLSHNPIKDTGCRWIASMLQLVPNLLSLSLVDCKITDDGLKYLRTSLAYSNELPKLECLYLSGNLFGDEGLISFSDVFRINKALTTISLCSLSITKTGVEAILQSLEHNTSIKELDLYNSTLNIECPDLLNRLCEIVSNNRLERSIEPVIQVANFDQSEPNLIIEEVPLLDELLQDNNPSQEDNQGEIDIFPEASAFENENENQNQNELFELLDIQVVNVSNNSMVVQNVESSDEISVSNLDRESTQVKNEIEEITNNVEERTVYKFTDIIQLANKVNKSMISPTNRMQDQNQIDHLTKIVKYLKKSVQLFEKNSGHLETEDNTFKHLVENYFQLNEKVYYSDDFNKYQTENQDWQVIRKNLVEKILENVELFIEKNRMNLKLVKKYYKKLQKLQVKLDTIDKEGRESDYQVIYLTTEMKERRIESYELLGIIKLAINEFYSLLRLEPFPTMEANLRHDLTILLNYYKFQANFVENLLSNLSNGGIDDRHWNETDAKPIAGANKDEAFLQQDSNTLFQIDHQRQEKKYATSEIIIKNESVKNPEITKKEISAKNFLIEKLATSKKEGKIVDGNQELITKTIERIYLMLEEAEVILHQRTYFVESKVKESLQLSIKYIKENLIDQQSFNINKIKYSLQKLENFKIYFTRWIEENQILLQTKSEINQLKEKKEKLNNIEEKMVTTDALYQFKVKTNQINHSNTDFLENMKKYRLKFSKKLKNYKNLQNKIIAKINCGFPELYVEERELVVPYSLLSSNFHFLHSEKRIFLHKNYEKIEKIDVKKENEISYYSARSRVENDDTTISRTVLLKEFPLLNEFYKKLFENEIFILEKLNSDLILKYHVAFYEYSLRDSILFGFIDFPLHPTYSNILPSSPQSILNPSSSPSSFLYLSEYLNPTKPTEQPPTFLEKLTISRLIIQAVCYFHSLNVVHSDLQVEKVIIVDNKPKIIGFEYAFVVNEIHPEDQIFPPPNEYVAPEVQLEKKFSKMSDMFAVGVILYQIFFKGPLLSILDSENKYSNFPASHLTNLIDLLSKLLSEFPENRPSAEEVLFNDFFINNKHQKKQIEQEETLNSAEHSKIKILALKQHIEICKLGKSLANRKLSFDRKNSDIVNASLIAFSGIESEEELRKPLFITFLHEEGIDCGGLTTAFYELLFKGLVQPEHKLFQASSPPGLYLPFPVDKESSEEESETQDKIEIFRTIGKLLVKCIFDGRTPNISFSPVVYKYLLYGDAAVANLHDFELFDQSQARYLRKMLLTPNSDKLLLNFSGLCEGGEQIELNDENKQNFVELKIKNELLTRRKAHLEALRSGFLTLSVLKSHLALFTEFDLKLLFSGENNLTSEDILNTLYFANFEIDSKTPEYLREIINEYSVDDLRLFLHFVTNETSIPVGGLRNPGSSTYPMDKITIYYIQGGDRLPVVHTCWYRLDLPDYPSKEKLQTRLQEALLNHRASAGSYNIA